MQNEHNHRQSNSCSGGGGGKPSKTLNKNSWAVIKQVADASQGPNYWSIGDTKQVHLSGTAGGATRNNDYWVYIIGFDHNKSKEGIGIAFQGFKTAKSGGVDIALVGTNYGTTASTTGFVMNQSKINSGGWNGSYAYTTLCPQIKAILPSDLQTVIRTTTLYTDNTGNASTAASTVTTNSNEVYYLAQYEVFGFVQGANDNEKAQQAQYDYYKAGNSKVKYRSDSTSNAAYWWLRSPKNTTVAFCIVGIEANPLGGNANYPFAAAPAFKV